MNQNNLDEVKRRLVSLVRCVHVKRAVESAEPVPRLNFWLVIQGALLDVAVLDWCVLFGTDGEELHWKNVVPALDQAAFKSGLVTATGLADSEWPAFWNEMKSYRDNYVSHCGVRKPGDIYPRMEPALKSAGFYYQWLFNKRLLNGSPPSLDDYARDFRDLADEVAVAALDATRGILERVDSNF
jgi:hypothetical protein